MLGSINNPRIPRIADMGFDVREDCHQDNSQNFLKIIFFKNHIFSKIGS